jgi:hypothetical protein
MATTTPVRTLENALSDLTEAADDVAVLIKKEPGLIDPLAKNHVWLSRLETAVQDFRSRQK